MKLFRSLALLSLCLLCPIVLCPLAHADEKSVATTSEKTTPPDVAVRDLLKRLLPRQEAKFALEVIPADVTNGAAQDVFEIQSQDGKIVLRGNNAVSLASALNYYLQNYANAQVAWNGINQLKLPTPLPDVNPKVHQTGFYSVRLAYQPATHGYTTAYWNWERWEQEIDFLALNGFNKAILVTGQEAIWQALWKSYGYDDAAIRQWLVPPAHAPWQAMGLLENTGGSLPQSVIDARLKLGQKVVTRLKELGIEPILPGYFGTVPKDFGKKKAGAPIMAQGRWMNELTRPDYVDPTDPLFAEIAAKYYAAIKANFGELHSFWATPFYEGAKTGDVSLTDSGKAIYTAMEQATPKATWVIPSTQEDPIPSLVVGFEKIEPEEPADKKDADAKDTNAKDADAKNADDKDADGEPKPKKFDRDRLLFLDTAADRLPLYRDNSAFGGAPWVWCVRANEAGQSGLFGDLTRANRGPVAVLGDEKPGQLKGFGVTAHDPRTNFIYWDLLLDNTWRTEPVNVGPWVLKFARGRYGMNAPTVERAWSLLRAVSYTNQNNTVPAIVASRPFFIAPQGKSKDETGQRYRIAKEMGETWKVFIDASTDLDKAGGPDTYDSDLVDVGAQALDALAGRYQVEISKAYRARDKENLAKLRDKMVGLMSDMDELLSTRREFMTGPLIEDARRLGNTPDEKNLLEQDARSLLTTWSIPPTQRDLSHRNWAGLVSGYYLPRWKMWLDALNESLNSGQPVNDAKLLQQISAHEVAWAKQTGKLSAQPAGDPVILSKKLWTKYGEDFTRAPEMNTKTITTPWTPDDVTTDHIIWTMDVSEFVKKPDDYEVEFKASGGKGTLLIFRIAFFQDNREIAGKVQNGRTGAYHRENIYKLTVKNVDRTKPVIFKAEVAGDANTDTTGTITVRRAERKERE